MVALRAAAGTGQARQFPGLDAGPRSGLRWRPGTHGVPRRCLVRRTDRGLLRGPSARARERVAPGLHARARLAAPVRRRVLPPLPAPGAAVLRRARDRTPRAGGPRRTGFVVPARPVVGGIRGAR